MIINRRGIEFRYHDDTLIWSWPWKRKGQPKYISVGASGTGKLGDARFKTLREVKEFWDSFPYDESIGI